MSQRIYQLVTDRILDLLELGVVPWKEPWSTTGKTVPPSNLVSLRPYRGINVFLLIAQHFGSPYWVTYKQALDLGGHVRQDPRFIGEFLEHLESERHNSVRTRNLRLAAIRSFFRYVALSEPAHALLCQQILAIPAKRYDHRPVAFLNQTEIEALLNAASPTTRIGRRDRALLLIAVQTGLRVSELIQLRGQDVVLGTGAHLRCLGKGRKERCTPLRQDAVSMLTSWLRERNGGPDDPVFPTVRGHPLSRDAVERLVAKYAAKAAEACPSLKRKHVTPHVLRHSAAMDLLQHGVDRSVIALWLGHESMETTEIYLHADLKMKEAALSHTAPLSVKPGRYRPGDDVLAYLESL